MVRSTIRRLSAAPWIAEILAALGGLVYTAQLWRFAHLQESVLDEGAYVYKGLLFASGQYTPFQPYGPWTNHMPLAFLIPGYLQTWFGPGLRTARFAAIFFAILLAVGMWVLGRRLGNRWWAAAVIWALALNPALLKTYSTAVTQGLVACMLVWTLVLTLGGRRPLWQLLLGSALAGLALMTRFNMLPLLPLLVLYITWQYGLKTAALAALTGGIVVIFWHALYWPDILQGWTRLPRELSPFLDGWRLPQPYEQSWDPSITLNARLLSAFHGLRFNFLALVGAAAALILWPRGDAWKDRDDRRSALFLAVLFAALLLSHTWAALGKDYCVFCLAGYIAFFAEIGLLLVILTAASWRQRLPLPAQVAIALLVIILSAGIGYGAFEHIGEQLYNLQTPRWLLGDFQAGAVPLGAVLTNKYGVEAQELRRLLPLAFGLLGGVGLVLLAFAVSRMDVRLQTAVNSGAERPATGVSRGARGFGYWALVLTLAAGALLGPSIILGGGYDTYDCDNGVVVGDALASDVTADDGITGDVITADVIASVEAAGHHLAQALPPGSSVYWKGTLSAVPLLYTRGIEIYPAQINDGYSMLAVGDDLDLITRFGRWNETLAHRWAQEADFIIIEQRSYKGWLRDVVRSGDFEELERTLPTFACRSDSYLRIFKRRP